MLFIHHSVSLIFSSDAHSISAQQAFPILSFVSLPFYSAHRNAWPSFLPFLTVWYVTFFMCILWLTIISQVHFISYWTFTKGIKFFTIPILKHFFVFLFSTQATACLSSCSSCVVHCGQCMPALPNQTVTFPQVVHTCSSRFASPRFFLFLHLRDVSGTSLWSSNHPVLCFDANLSFEASFFHVGRAAIFVSGNFYASWFFWVFCSNKHGFVMLYLFIFYRHLENPLQSSAWHHFCAIIPCPSSSPRSPECCCVFHRSTTMRSMRHSMPVLAL